MKPIEARKQVALGPGRCLQLALTGMSYRMFRAGVTIAILALAVAFLVHMLAYGLLSRRTELSAFGELASNRQAGRVVSRLTSPDSLETILATLGTEASPANPKRQADAGEANDQAASDGDEARSSQAVEAGRLAEYRAWTDVPERRFGRARQAARAGAEFEAYLANLPAASQAVLVGELDQVELFSRLREAERYQNFRESVAQMDFAPPLGSWEDFQTLVNDGWPVALKLAHQIREAHAQAIEQVRHAYPDRSVRELLENPPDRLVRTMRQAGFGIDPDQIKPISRFVRQANDLQTLSRLTTVEQVRQAVARRTGMAIKDVSTERVLGYVTGMGSAKWFAGVLQEAGGPERLTAERLVELSKTYRRQNRLRDAVGAAPPSQTAGFMGLPPRTLYLIGLSFLVCIVGVANAMLMAVTERFAEIATMKCLGAMDRFVMMMFVFEAAIQGVVGGVIGLVIGILLALLRGLIDYGTLLSSGLEAIGQVSLSALLALLVGVGLATFAAVGPSFVAARLAPMEAMRVE